MSSPGRSVRVKAEPQSAVKAPDAPSLPEGGKVAKALPPIPQKEAKLMAQKLGRLDKKGKPELKEQYSQCKTQAEKSDFFYNVYLLDPEVSSKQVKKLDSDKQKEQVSTMEGWWTKEQIAQDKGILPHMDNYKALTDASVAGLQERPHEDEQLAKLGIKQYEYTFVEKKKKHSKEQELALQEHVEDVDTSDFVAMRLALGGGPKQKTITTKGASASVAGGSLPGGGNEHQVKPEELYKQQYKKTKGALSGVQSECNGIDMVKEVLSQVAGFDDMVKGYQQYCDQAQKKLQKLWKDSMPELVTFPAKAETLAEDQVESKAEELQALGVKILEGHKDIKKQLAVIKAWASNPK